MAQESSQDQTKGIFSGFPDLSKIRDQSDLLGAVALVGIVVMLIVPLPSVLLDIFMAMNLAVGLVLVLSSTYLEDTLEFSVFPTLLLMTTLFRLALNVSSTRLILLEGQDFDGEVVRSFGNFVVGGDYIVGFIIFIILVLIQFMVITKGSERVAEVAARFTLDAMPGKQMAIDADLNAGLIEENEARERREKISKEADFYGAMDGASKFVKGDTIAGIIITLINIIGGVVIGWLSGQFNSISEILSTYTLLTVGDGLVSIVPSLLISVATGIVVTKAVSEENLGNEVVSQLTAKPKVLLITSGVFMMFALIPGLPKFPFILMSGILFTMAYYMMDVPEMIRHWRGAPEDSGTDPHGPDEGGASSDGASADSDQEGQSSADSESGPEDVSSLLNVDTLELEIGYGLIPMVDPNQGGDLLNRVKMIRRQIAMELGLVVPAVRIRDNMQLAPNSYAIKLKGIEIGEGEIYSDRFLAMDPGMVSHRVEGIDTVEPAFKLPAIWIEETTREDAELAGYTVVDAPSVVATHLTELIKGYASEILGRQETLQLVEKLKEQYPAVVDAAVPEMAAARLGLVQKVLQSLLHEGVSIRNLTSILEVVADFVEHAKDINELVEHVRAGLARQITREYTIDNTLKVLTLVPTLEQQFAEQVQRSGAIHGALDPEKAQLFFDNLNAQIEKMLVQGHTPVLICSPVIRFHFKNLVERVAPQLVVLSFNEIVMDVEVDNVGSVGVEASD